MRYLLTLLIDTRAETVSERDIEDDAYLACNEIAENHPGWLVDIIEGPEPAND